jgi:hypothetical protein
MGTLTFQATAGGSVNLLGPNISGTVNLTLPSADGTSGQPLQTNGSGTLSFANLAIANGGTGVTSFAANQIHYGSFSQSANLTFNGTTLTANTLNLTNALGTAYGGTGLTSFTANGVVYASSTSALATGSAFVFDGTNVGIGTSSPIAKLDVGGALTDTVPATYGGTIRVNSATQTTVQAIGGIEFPVAGDGYGYKLQQISSSGANLVFASRAASATWTERMRIDSSGNLLVGTTVNTGGLLSGFNAIINGGATYTNIGHSSGTGSGSTYIQFAYAGTTIGSIAQSGTAAVLYNVTSDYRLKTVVGAVTGHGARIDALHPVEYTWNSNGQRTRGFLAHQFQEVYADSVTGTKDAVDADGNPIHQGMQAGSTEVIADLVAEIQSLRKRLTDAGIA